MADSLIEVYGATQIAARVQELAADITRAYGEREIAVLGVSDDSFMFLADLLRAVKATPRTAFLRYDHQSLGGVQDLSFSTQMDVTNRHVLLVEGVLDTGVTHEYLIKHLEGRGAADVKLCVLADKPDRRRVGLEADWRAFETHENYVFGYGLGYGERWRELPYIATFAKADGET
ncbi:MAG: phosphoribosyltransferase [Pyrinomonadaceae bacterium]